MKKKKWTRIKTVFGIMFGIFLAFSGVFFPLSMLMRQEQRWIENPTFVEVQKGESLTNIAYAPISYTMEDYHNILESLGITNEIYYHEPFGRQITMNQAFSAVKILIDQLFPDDILDIFLDKTVPEHYEEEAWLKLSKGLRKAILYDEGYRLPREEIFIRTALLSTSVQDYYNNPQYSFWRVVFSNDSGIDGEALVNAMDGKVWQLRINIHMDEADGEYFMEGKIYDYYDSIYLLDSLSDYSDEKYSDASSGINESKSEQIYSGTMEHMFYKISDISDNLREVYYKYTQYLNEDSGSITMSYDEIRKYSVVNDFFSGALSEWLDLILVDGYDWKYLKFGSETSPFWLYGKISDSPGVSITGTYEASTFQLNIELGA